MGRSPIRLHPEPHLPHEEILIFLVGDHIPRALKPIENHDSLKVVLFLLEDFLATKSLNSLITMSLLFMEDNADRAAELASTVRGRLAGAGPTG